MTNQKFRQFAKKTIFRLCQLNINLLKKLTGPTRFNALIDEKTLIAALRKKSGQQQTAFYSVKVYHEFAELAKNWDVTPEHVLEIGTGCSLTTLACFLAGGAKEATGIDIQEMDRKEDAYYSVAAEYIAVTAGFGWWRHFVDANKPSNIHFNAWTGDQFLDRVNQVNYVAPYAADEMPFADDSFNFIYSNAALEHVHLAKETVKEISRVLKPGGITCHAIDLRDHNSTDPLGFCRFSEDEWQCITGRYGAGKGIERLLESSWDGRVYCNRLSASDWVRLFEEAGFEILDLNIVVMIDSRTIPRDEFEEPFCNKELDDLSKLVIQIAAQLRKVI